MRLVSRSLPSFLPPATPRSSPAPSCLIDSGFLCHGEMCIPAELLRLEHQPGPNFGARQGRAQGRARQMVEGAEWSVAWASDVF